MPDTETLTYKQWVDSIEGKGSQDGYQAYVKEQEDIIRQLTLKDLIENPYGIEDDENVGDMSDREVQNRLLILTSKYSKRLISIKDDVWIIKNILVFFMIFTIISILVSLAMLISV